MDPQGLMPAAPWTDAVRCILRSVDLEPRTIERAGERCEECGATLTPAELKTVLESGGPALCTVHAAEAAALPDPDEAA
jgi:hypothetical protein